MFQPGSLDAFHIMEKATGSISPGWRREYNEVAAVSRSHFPFGYYSNVFTETSFYYYLSSQLFVRS